MCIIHNDSKCMYFLNTNTIFNHSAKASQVIFNLSYWINFYFTLVLTIILNLIFCKSITVNSCTRTLFFFYSVLFLLIVLKFVLSLVNSIIWLKLCFFVTLRFLIFHLLLLQKCFDFCNIFFDLLVLLIVKKKVL